VAALPAAALSAADEAAIGALSRVLEHAARELHVEFAQQGRVDYAYVTGAARAALTEAGLPTELALRTGLAFTHILVDEFQDTSLAQFQLLESLTAACRRAIGARCSSWAIRCSRSIASAMRRSACSSARASMASAACG